MIEQLVKVQNELKAPKSQYNSFGKYSYRNAEDIFEAAKPICFKYGLFLSISDEVIEVGGSLFVESTASITDGDQSFSCKSSGRSRFKPQRNGQSTGFRSI